MNKTEVQIQKALEKIDQLYDRNNWTKTSFQYEAIKTIFSQALKRVVEVEREEELNYINPAIEALSRILEHLQEVRNEITIKQINELGRKNIIEYFSHSEVKGGKE